MSGSGSLSEAYLRQSPACHWVVDEEGRFEQVFGDSCPVFGAAPAMLLGRAPSEVLDSESAGVWSDGFSRALAGEQLSLLRRIGGSAWLIALFPVTRPHRPLCAAGMAQEVTAWSSAERELRHTVLSALKAQEFERRMVARFLHDKIGQNLTAMGLQLDLVRMDMECLAPQTSDRVIEIQKLLGSMMEEVREYSYELNPSTVERAGLRPALDRIAARVRGRFAGSLRINADPSLKIDPKIASALFQIAQEAIENAVQHSCCSAIEIAVKSTRTGPLLEIRDNGRGFDPADILGARRGLGILSMEHYAAQAGLDLSIKSSRETGTVVRAAAAESD